MSHESNDCVYMVIEQGLLVIQLTAWIKKMHPPHCGSESITCTGPTTGQMTFLLAGFGLLIVGAAGIRPCNLAFGVDQFNPNTESGKKGNQQLLQLVLLYLHICSNGVFVTNCLHTVKR